MIEKWESLRYPENIKSGYCISTFGRICNPLCEPHYSDYHSTNGHDYSLILMNDGSSQLILTEELVALTFLKIPDSLNGKSLCVSHKNYDLRNNEVDNLEWIEFIEEWVPLEYPKVRSGMYEISNIGRVRNKNTGKILRADESFGYKCHNLAGIQPSTHSKVFVHRLVAKHFVSGFSETNNIVNHINFKRTSTNFMYLEWVTQSQNVSHGILIGSTDSITTEEADLIRDMLFDPVYKGNPTSIYNAIDHNRYPGITGPHTISMIKQNKQCQRSNKYNLDDIKFPKYERISTDELDMIRDLLFENDGSLKTVYDKIDHSTHPYLTYDVIKLVKDNKTYLRSDKYDLTNISFEKKRNRLTVAELDMIRDLLFKYSGDRRKVYQELDHEKYPHITIPIIAAIKSNKYYRNSNKYNLDEISFPKLK